MREIVWYFPGSLEEAAGLLKKDGVIPHGGGTNILRSGMKNVRGLIDLDALALKSFSTKGGNIRMGAALSFAEASKGIRKIDPESILFKALSSASSTPLRNRITLGGSIACFPPWSDLMGPLIALDAEVSLAGRKQGTFPITDYATDRNLRGGSLITAVAFKNKKWTSYYYRATATHFDYPAFTLSIVSKKERSRIEDIRVVVVGCANKFKRLVKLEESLMGKPVQDVRAEGIAGDVEIDFNRKKFLAPEYMRHLVCVSIERGFTQLFER